MTDQAKQAAPVGLAFTHKMAKINVNITPGAGVSAIESVSILNVLPTVSFNPTTGETGAASGDAESIAVSNAGAALIPAQTIDGGLLSIVTDQGTATYTVSNKVFEAGKQYTLKITVNLRSVGIETEITGWASEGTVIVNPPTGTPTVLTATSDHQGWIITKDGYIYENKEAVEAAGREGVALIFYVGEPGYVNKGTHFRGLAIALSGTESQGAWGYHKIEATNGGKDTYELCLEDQFPNYSDAVSNLSGDEYGLQNTMSLSTHIHYGDTNHESNAAKKLMDYDPTAPVGTSGWFIGSIVQWNLFLRECCDITDDATVISDEPDPEASTDNAAYITVPSTLRSLGAPFREAGYPNPFLSMFEDEDYCYGFWTSTEVNEKYAWSILLDEDSDFDVDDGGIVEPDPDPTREEDIYFTRFTRGQGLHIYPFLAF